MRRPFVVEREARALVTDGVNAGDELPSSVAAALLPCGQLPMRIVGRIGRILRERVQEVGQHQFLMLLFMMQPDFHDRKDPFGFRRGFDQLRHGGIDMGAIGGRLGNAGPRDQAALRPGLPRARRHVIGIEQKGEALVERTIDPAQMGATETARKTR